MLILQILKIIGFVLLGIVGLILLLVGIVLFVPVRYKGRAVKNDETYYVNAKVSWLLAIVMLKVNFDKNGLSKSLRIAFHYIFKDDVKEDDAASVAGEVNAPVEEEESAESVQEADEHEGTESTDEYQPSETVPNTEKPETPEDTSDEHTDDALTEAETEEFVYNDDDMPDEAGKSGKKKKKEKKQKSEELSFGKRLLNLYENKDYIESAIEKKQKAVDKTWSRVKKIIVHLLPRKLYGKLAFGFDDPATTGKVLGAIAVLYCRMGELLQVSPNFNEKELDADVRLKGKIRIFTVLFLAALVYFNKDMRKLVKYIKHCSEVNIDEERAKKQKEKENG